MHAGQLCLCPCRVMDLTWLSWMYMQHMIVTTEIFTAYFLSFFTPAEISMPTYSRFTYLANYLPISMIFLKVHH